MLQTSVLTVRYPVKNYRNIIDFKKIELIEQNAGKSKNTLIEYV